MSEIIIKTDGGSRGNPGPAAIGVDMQMGDWSFSYGKCIGHATNNVAEYYAIIDASEKIVDSNYRLTLPNKIERVIFKLDSELVVKQLNGQYRVKDQNLVLLYTQVKQSIERLKNQGIGCEVVHIPREENKLADKEVNLALDSKKNN